MAKIIKGNIEEVKAASSERIELVLLRKDFSNESFVRIELTSATISKCIFNSSKFYGNTYTECDFISCDFTKADFLNVKFINCKFHECNFNEVTLQEVNFENCSIITCSFQNANFKNDVIGLNQDDFNIIHEEASLNEEQMTNFGFQKNDDESFSISSSVDNGPKVSLDIEKESEEYGKNMYRVMFNVDDNCILSDTFEKEESENYEEISLLIKTTLIFGNKKVKADYFNGDEEKFNLYQKAYSEVKNKFKEQ